MRTLYRLALILSLLLSVLGSSIAAEETPAGGLSSPELVKAYLASLRRSDFQAFLELMETPASLRTAPALRFPEVRAAEQKFHAQVQALSSDIDWDNFELITLSECTARSEWRCLTKLVFTTPHRRIELRVQLLKSGEYYRLDQREVLAEIHTRPITDALLLRRGEELYTSLGCGVCHRLREGERLVGPSLYRIYGRVIESQGGETQRVDEAHLRSSLLEPRRFIMRGYPPAMPSYRGRLGAQEMSALVAYLKSL